MTLVSPQTLNDLEYRKFEELGGKIVVRTAIFDSSGDQVDSFGTDPVGLKNIAASPINPATEDTLTLIRAKTDAIPSDPAREGGNLASIKAKTDNLDLATTSLRDAIVGATPKTLKDLWDSIELIRATNQDFGGGSGLNVNIIADQDKYIAGAVTPVVYNITMTSADTEYSQALPANTKRLTMQCRTAFDVRFAFVTGKVATPTAPYMTMKSGCSYYEDTLTLTDKTIYVACGSAGKVLELICWTY